MVPATAQSLDELVGPVTVVVSGIEGELRDNVLAFLTIAEQPERSLISQLNPFYSAPGIAPEELERRHRIAPGQIRDALMPFGHYLPQIQAELIETDTGYEARYAVDAGPPARLRNVEVRVEGEGADDPDVQRALGTMALRRGDQLLHRRYEALKDALLDAAYNRGHLRARWLGNEIRVQPDRLEADIRLVLDTGPRFYFGEIEIDAERLHPDFVARFTDIEPGEPYDVRRLLALQLALNSSTYFSAVEIRAEAADADARNHIPVRVSTRPARPQRYTVGFGYATDTGPRLNLGVLLRRVNERGHRLTSDLRLSSIETSMAAHYAIPIREVAADMIDLSLTARQLQTGDAESRQYSLGASEYVGWRGFRRRSYVQLQREEFQFDDGPIETTKLLYPGITLTRDTSDDRIFPRRGYSVQLDLRGGSERLVSDVSFLRISASARRVRALGNRGRLLLRAATGMLDTVDFERLPPTQRFFAGGDRSVRGYDFQAIGERNDAGAVIGGRYLLVGSVEVERLLFGDFGGALFLDAGDAFNGSFDAKIGAGIGLRWRSPVGMVRLDIAHPFDTDERYRIHFSMGADL